MPASSRISGCDQFDIIRSSGIDTALDLTFLFISGGPEVGVGELLGRI